jgi:hypothetical protein
MPASSDIPPMEPRRYKLVPDDTSPPPPSAGPVKRRYSLARVAPASRSALGVDRLERMEAIAERELRNGTGVRPHSEESDR